jgi:hypothetical protein
MAAVSLCSANLLENPSFETLNSSNGMPQGWSMMKRGIFHEAHAVETSVVLDGKNAVRLENPTDLTKGVTILWMQSNFAQKFKAVAPGTEMEFSVYVRGGAHVCTFPSHRCSHQWFSVLVHHLAFSLCHGADCNQAHGQQTCCFSLVHINNVRPLIVIGGKSMQIYLQVKCNVA